MQVYQRKKCFCPDQETVVDFTVTRTMVVTVLPNGVAMPSTKKGANTSNFLNILPQKTGLWVFFLPFFLNK